MRKFIVLSIVLLMLAGFAITSSAVTLLADQDVNVGTVTVAVVGPNLVVTYTVTAPWVLGDTHLYVGHSVPAKSAPGRFPYGPEDVFLNEVVYTILLADLDAGAGDTLVIAAQAEVTHSTEIDPDTSVLREETAWAEGPRIRPNKNWAMYFTFDVPE